MVFLLIRTVRLMAQLLITLLCARAILSWFAAANPYSQIGRIYQGLVRFTEPLVLPARMLIRKLGIQTGMFDFSVLVAFFMIELAETVIIRLLYLLV